MIELIESTAMVCPRNTCARFSSGALGSKFGTRSLRTTSITVGRVSVLAMARRRCPCAAARVSDSPETEPKSALPAITALIEPMPVITTLLTRKPCLVNSPMSSAT